jgi:hypothetical protein
MRCDYLEGRHAHCKELVSGYICIFLTDGDYEIHGTRYLALCVRHMHALQSCMLHEVISYDSYVVGKIMTQ